MKVLKLLDLRRTNNDGYSSSFVLKIDSIISSVFSSFFYNHKISYSKIKYTDYKNNPVAVNFTNKGTSLSGQVYQTIYGTNVPLKMIYKALYLNNLLYQNKSIQKLHKVLFI